VLHGVTRAIAEVAGEAAVIAGDLAQQMARPGIEPGTPRFSVDQENLWIVPELQDVYW
jgi:hypothetical protein